MIIVATKDYRDLQHGEVIRPKGQIMDVSDERAQELIGKGLAKTVNILVIEESQKNLTVDELKEALDAKGIEYDSKAKKAELQELLEGAE